MSGFANADDRRLYAAVAGCALVVYLGALRNGFAVDDVPIIVLNPLVAAPSGIWRTFGAPYWPPDLGGHMYRPLVIAGFALDRWVDGPVWFHAVNLLWHAGTAVAVTALARRWADTTAALVAGVLFAVHPVHVEAVANVVGRAELMAALFVGLAVYAALVRERVGWSAAALALGLLSKENAAVAPALIGLGWLVGLARPDRRRIARFVASWVLVGGAYAVVRAVVRHPFAGSESIAPLFVGESPLTVRLTAMSTRGLPRAWCARSAGLRCSPSLGSGGGSSRRSGSAGSVWRSSRSRTFSTPRVSTSPSGRSTSPPSG